VTFNASLLKELRSIALLKQALASHHAPGSRTKAPTARVPVSAPLFDRVETLRIHRIDGEGRLSELGASSKLDTRRTFLTQLHQVGIEAAEHWLRDHRGDLGQRSTISLEEELPP
jgi:NTE family protein